MKSSPALSRVLKGELCAGCGLCAGISPDAVRMSTLAPGYARPLQTAQLTDEQERVIQQACPGLVVAPWDSAEAKGAQRSEYWGPWRKSLTGHATDAEVRYSGASGGALSALAIHALETGAVAQVLHITADSSQPTRNITRISRNRAEVLSGAGSRYAASSPLAEISSLLDAGIPTLIIGKPCDVSALRQLALLDPRVNSTFPLMMSFFCGGLPSHAGADRIVQAMGLEPERIVQFRYRGEGWPGLTKAIDESGASGEMRYEDSWGGHLSKEVQFRCKICPDAVGGTADIACADAWYGGETGYPQFEEQDGRSLILTRTEAGDRLLASAVETGALTSPPLSVEAVAISDVLLMQPSQARRKRRVGARILASRVMAQPVPKMAGLSIASATRKEGVSGLLRDFLGTIRRIAVKKR